MNVAPITMILRSALAAALLLLAACGGEKLVREPVVPDTLSAVAERITDETIRADRQVIEMLRSRLRALNETGRWPLDNYHVCKAQAWLDFAEIEYTDNDRGSVVESALQQARALIERMEADATDIPMDTPVLPESMVVRQDLWDFVALTKGEGANRCSDCSLARLEVQLVAAGHDHRELGWRHAASGVMAAERLQREVVAGAQQCAAAAAAPAIGPVAASAVGVRAGGVATGELSLPVVVHFAYDQSTLSNETAAVLARIAWILRGHPQITVELVGHTDPRGDVRYNEALGERRAAAVRAYLLASGIDAARVTHTTRGERESLRVSDERLRAYAKDRRVEMIFSQLPDLRTERQLLDLQPDR